MHADREIVRWDEKSRESILIAQAETKNRIITGKVNTITNYFEPIPKRKNHTKLLDLTPISCKKSKVSLAQTSDFHHLKRKKEMPQTTTSPKTNAVQDIHNTEYNYEQVEKLDTIFKNRNSIGYILSSIKNFRATKSCHYNTSMSK
jgi:hypothetical protein